LLLNGFEVVKEAEEVDKIKHLLISIILILSLSLADPLLGVSALGTSPILSALLDYSVLGGAEVTNTGPTVTDGIVGVSPGSSITNFPPGLAGGDNLTHLLIPPDANAAQAEALSVFGALDQTCDTDYGVGPQELGTLSLVPGVYCVGAGGFQLTGNLTLTGGVDEVYIFKSSTTLITASGSSVTGGDPCDIWWRIGSSTTLGTNTSFRGTVISQNGVNAMQTGATLDGRFLGLSAATVTLDTNTIAAPVCLVAPVPATTEPMTQPVSGLPDTGGAPIQNGVFPWGWVIVGSIGAAALIASFLAHRRNNLPEQ